MIGGVRGATFVFAVGPRSRAADCSICGAVPDGAPALPEVLASVDRARADGSLAAVYVRAGGDDGEDGGVRAAEPFVTEIKKRFDLLVSLDAQPPADGVWIDRAYAVGADAVSFNVEVWDRADRAHFLSALSHASIVFPAGAVTSHLVLGVEPPDSTRDAIDALADAGVVPVLAPPGGREPSEDPAPLYAHARDAIRRRHLPTRWVRTLCDDPSALELDLYGSPLAIGALTRLCTARLSDLRRLLRVKQVRDSLDSSGL